MATYDRREQDERLWLARSAASRGAESADLTDTSLESSSSSKLASKYAPAQQVAAQRAPQADHHSPAGSYAYPTVMNVDGELVQVNSAEDVEEARAAIKSLQLDYGVQVSSQKGVDALRLQYDSLPDAVKAMLRTDVWQLKELRALQRALAHFAPLLGQQRQASGVAIPQQVTSVSKLHEAATQNSPSGRLDGALARKTSGEYFSQGRNFSLFSAATNQTIDGFDNEQSLQATATHEIAHGLLGYRLVDFVAEVGYWQNAFDTLSRPGAEKPVTPYGATSPGEDLAETVKFFFSSRDMLRGRCPKRHDFMVKEVATWHAQQPAK